VAGRASRIQRTRRGDYRLRLPENERELLRTLPQQLREIIGTSDSSLRRLFPPAYADDAERNAEYEELVRDDLIAARRASLDVMESTIDAQRLDEEQLVAWLSVLNDLRLVLGTRLDVTEEMYGMEMAESDPRSHAFSLFTYLGWLEEQIVEALASGIDAPRSTG
jgi:uncharacterized protein DUF2017